MINPPKRLQDMKNIGAKFEQVLARVGIETPQQLRAADAFDVYARLRRQVPSPAWAGNGTPRWAIRSTPVMIFEQVPFMMSFRSQSWFCRLMDVEWRCSAFLIRDHRLRSLHLEAAQTCHRVL